MPIKNCITVCLRPIESSKQGTVKQNPPSHPQPTLVSHHPSHIPVNYQQPKLSSTPPHPTLSNSEPQSHSLHPPTQTSDLITPLLSSTSETCAAPHHTRTRPKARAASAPWVAAAVDRVAQWSWRSRRPRDPSRGR